MFRRLTGLLLAEPFAEMLEPRGESSFVSGPVVRSAFIPRVVGHSTARENPAKKIARPLKAARTILIGFYRVNIR